MKQYISRLLKAVAGFLVFFPVGYIVLAAILFDIPLNQCLGIILSPFYLITVVCTMISGWGLWEMQRWSWYLFIAGQALVSYESLRLILSVSESHHKIAAYLVSVGAQLLLMDRVAREIRVPYLFPSIRWWESNARYRLSVPVTITAQAGDGTQVYEGEILDLSPAGCFIKFRPKLSQGESLSLRFKMFGYEVHCDGIAVWIAQSAVTHPKGIGVKFSPLSRSQRRPLRSIQKRLKKISLLYRRGRYWMTQAEFIGRLEAIERNQAEAPISIRDRQSL